MARKRDIYKITVTNWDKYNGTLKRGHKKIMVSTGFLTDAKIATLPQGGKLLYLGLLLRCGEVTSSSIEASYDLLVSFAGGSGHVVSRLMDQLQSLQLVTYSKIESLINIKEKNIKEYKRKEENEGQLGKSAAPPPAAQAPHKLFFLWNEHSSSLPKSRGLNATRKKQADARWREHPDEAYWIEVIKKITASNFCTGKNDRGWTATFDWFLKPDTHLKAMEGKYDNNKTAISTAKTRAFDKLDEIEAKWEAEAKQ